MLWKAAITWESGIRPPVTVRVMVAAGTVASAASRAVRAAKRAAPGQRYQSVLVLLEKAGPGDGQDGES
jgi:hypothetical protein